jgi:diketogulonate reductase-like aldo/keto reductase
MEFKQLPGGGRIPVLGFGTWGIGGNGEPDHSKDEEAVIAIRKAIELGMTHLDTAEYYGSGHAEELVAQAIEGFNREKLFVTTKVSPGNLSFEGVLSSCMKSLTRLSIDYIDLYLVHIPSPTIPITDTMKAMDHLVKEGLIRHIGVSNFSAEQMKEAQEATENRILTNQIEYNLIHRNQGKLTNDMESEIIPYCLEKDILVTAWAPVARGVLTKPGISLLDEMAEKYGKTQAQVAINWLITKPNFITIPKSITPSRIEENLGAVGWNLKPEDMKRLDELKYPGHVEY